MIPDPDFTHGTAAGDIDGDGDVDILAANVSNADIELPYLLINDGQGGFLANWQLLPNYNYGSPDLGKADRVEPESVLLEDMDGDGHVDLVTVPRARPISLEWVGGIAWNDGSGDFSVAERLVILPSAGIPPNEGNPIPTSSTDPVIADIDNDGDKDLLIVWNPEDSGNPQSKGSLQVLINHGRRVFADETVARVGQPPQAEMPSEWISEFFARDMNSDGCLDILFREDEVDNSMPGFGSTTARATSRR